MGGEYEVVGVSGADCGEKSAAALFMPVLPMAMGRKHGGRPSAGIMSLPVAVPATHDASALGDNT